MSEPLPHERLQAAVMVAVSTPPDMLGNVRTSVRLSDLKWALAEIAALRARVAELEALTPPGHVLVGMGARETVARALIDVHRRQFDLTTDPPPAALEKSLDYADAVLRALGVRGGA